MVDQAPAVPTEERLLRSAETLFAERGIGAVSLRAVMQAADANVASVHYHFGSKEALLEAVVRSRIDEVTSGRDALLEPLAGADAPDVRLLARAFIDPVLRIAQGGGGAWVRVIGQLLASNDPALAPISQTFFERNARFVAALQRLDPPPGPATIGFRLTQAMSLTLKVLGDLDHTRLLLAGDGTPPSVDEVVAELLDVVAAVLAGPPAPRTDSTEDGDN